MLMLMLEKHLQVFIGGLKAKIIYLYSKHHTVSTKILSREYDNN